MNGWVRLMKEHILMNSDDLAMTEKPFSTLEAWYWLLCAADWDGPHRGSVSRSLNSLCNEFDWTKQRLRTWLQKLEKATRIQHTSNTQTTCITIVNFHTYQGGATHEQHTSNTRATHEQNLTILPKRTKKKKEELDHKSSLPSVVKIEIALASPKVPGFREGTLPCGEFKNVYLLRPEMERLKAEYGERAAQVVQSLSCAIETQPKKYSYKNHYATALNWLRRESKPVKHEHTHKYETKTEQAARDFDRQMVDARKWAEEEDLKRQQGMI